MNKWKEERGSLSIEASFVFPIVFFVLLAVIYMCFYRVDKNNVRIIIDQAAEEQAVCMKEQIKLGMEKDEQVLSEHMLFYFLQDTLDAEEDLQEQVKEQLMDRLMMGTVERVAVEVSYTKVTVIATISINIGISQIKEFFTGTPLQYQTSIVIPVHNPSEFARIYDSMGEVLDDIKGLETVKEKLNLIN